MSYVIGYLDKDGCVVMPIQADPDAEQWVFYPKVTIVSELTTTDLPPGYTVERDIAVGYSYYDEQGNIVFQHPRDTDAARALVWQKYNKKQGK